MARGYNGAMTRRLILVAALLAIPSIYAQEKFAKSDAKQLTTDDIKKLVDSKAKMVVVDVREPDELEKLGTLEGVMNIPLGQVESRWSEVPKDVPLVVLCNRGARAGKAADVFKEHGYKDVSYGGLREWKARGWDLVYPKAGEKH